MKKIISCFVIIFSLVSQAQIELRSTIKDGVIGAINEMLIDSINRTIQVNNPGTLSTLLSPAELLKVDSLTLKGNINDRDFKTMRDSMKALIYLDLRGVTIVAYNGAGGTFPGILPVYSYPANAIPPYALYRYAPDYNKNLTTVLLPPLLKEIDSYAFGNCVALTSLVIPSSVSSIGWFAFSGCSALKTVNIPFSITSIGDNTFAGCSSLTSLHIPSSVSSIGQYAFTGCIGLSTLNLDSLATTTIGYGAFLGCSGLTSMTLPHIVVTISGDAFASCSGLTSINFPNTVKSIELSAFRNDISLTTINIPSSVNAIGAEAFYGCTSLSSIHASPVIPIDLSLSDSVFKGVNTNTCILYVPTGSKSAYQLANQWKDFKNIVEMVTAVPTVENATITLYPNSVKDGFYVKGLSGIALLRLYDINGKEMLTSKVTNDIISVAALPKGLYVAKIVTSEGTIERKLIKN